MAIKIISVCEGGNHVTVDRDGVTSIELADTLLDASGVDSADGHALRAYLKEQGIASKELLKAAVEVAQIDPKIAETVKQ